MTIDSFGPTVCIDLTECSNEGIDQSNGVDNHDSILILKPIMSDKRFFKNTQLMLSPGQCFIQSSSIQ